MSYLILVWFAAPAVMAILSLTLSNVRGEAGGQ
jgi:hypothetical protein